MEDLFLVNYIQIPKKIYERYRVLEWSTGL